MVLRPNRRSTLGESQVSRSGGGALAERRDGGTASPLAGERPVLRVQSERGNGPAIEQEKLR